MFARAPPCPLPPATRALSISIAHPDNQFHELRSRCVVCCLFVFPHLRTGPHAGVTKSWEPHEKLPACSLRTLLTRFLDITTPPTRQLLTLLATFCEDKDDEEHLNVLANVMNMLIAKSFIVYTYTVKCCAPLPVDVFCCCFSCRRPLAITPFVCISRRAHRKHPLMRTGAIGAYRICSRCSRSFHRASRRHRC